MVHKLVIKFEIALHHESYQLAGNYDDEILHVLYVLYQDAGCLDELKVDQTMVHF